MHFVVCLASYPLFDFWARLLAIHLPIRATSKAAHFEVLNVWRAAQRRGRAVQRLAGLAETHQSPGPDHERYYEDHQAIQSFLAGLPPRDAEILMLTAFEDLDEVEIAAILGCATTTVRVRLHRARRRAKDLLARTHGLPALSATKIPMEEMS